MWGKPKLKKVSSIISIQLKYFLEVEVRANENPLGEIQKYPREYPKADGISNTFFFISDAYL